ncbi:methylmalonyl Co-A mutase-associated GTPase MeaB [uncultured Friedmanniella sp.]|uniref:methylmalonyl Co-A mutase-associated GTPase MeaB n=1 Tax=uncultured Friedmanniella sp. TaxID=335381 RepID=UPI0035CA36AF
MPDWSATGGGGRELDETSGGRRAGSPLSDALETLLAGVRAGQPRAVGRLVTLIENSSPALPQIMAGLARTPGHAYVVGVTGPPGAGKSTTTAALVTALRARGQRVGVLAVDPTSPFTGGALLGDRVRMQQHALDPEVHIRSMATRGHLGGLAVAAAQSLRVLAAAGCATVVVETVGVGQSEIEVAALADVTVVLWAPGMGDGVQAAKAGILEVADLLVVNKADRDGASALVRELRTATSLAARPQGAWVPPVLTTVASEGTGMDELLVELDRFAAHAGTTGEADRRRADRARREIEGLAVAALLERWRTVAGARLDELAEQVRDGRTDPYAAAAAWLAAADGVVG